MFAEIPNASFNLRSAIGKYETLSINNICSIFIDNFWPV